MFVSVAAVLGATLGTVSGALTLCGLSLLCKNCKKNKFDRDDSADSERAKASILHTLTQFSVQKSTEPIQPQTLLKFPKIYKPKPSVTSPEVKNYSENAVTSEKVLTKPDSCDHRLEEDKEVTALTRQDSTDETPCAVNQSNAIPSSSSVLHPKLHFSLRLHTESRELHITIIEAEQVSMETGSEGYVSGCVSVFGEQRLAQTAVRKLASRVQWGEAMVFSLPSSCSTESTESMEGEVALTLNICDRFSRNTTLGTVRFKLADVGMMSDADCWVNLQPPKQIELHSTGELLLSLSYLPAANRLGVVVMKARGLQSDKLKDTIDLSVKLTLKHQTTKLKKKQTRRVKHKINPVWNEMMMLELPRELLTKSSLDMEVLNQTSPGTLLPLGRCQLGLQFSGTGLQHWQQMLDNPRKQIAMWHPLHA
ncbi:synaptotagmin-13 [Tachysurus fulvidraco]|uniref:synaptotagmin-13 n=1 Tax=Tachysurus fulvidraco TaxID=1234273 RepID=UPI001FEEE3D6|nr:synaptotagmin-13 [Tachysurus fulvidraco]